MYPAKSISIVIRVSNKRMEVVIGSRIYKKTSPGVYAREDFLQHHFLHHHQPRLSRILQSALHLAINDKHAHHVSVMQGNAFGAKPPKSVFYFPYILAITCMEDVANGLIKIDPLPHH